jgi:nitrogen fixation protein FixH
MIVKRGFTGRHMLAVMLGFFGVVIAVNVTMAVLAGRTFGGTVVDNSYVASQRFNRWLAEGRAQEQLGWTARLRLDGRRHVRVELTDRIGALEGAEVAAVARHPLGRESDVALRFRPEGNGVYVSQGALPAGRWQVHVEVRRAGDDHRLIETLA